MLGQDGVYWLQGIRMKSEIYKSVALTDMCEDLRLLFPNALFTNLEDNAILLC